jgi:peptidyl-prolyl cis-trans isomerase A (cyclophilin A)
MEMRSLDTLLLLLKKTNIAHARARDFGCDIPASVQNGGIMKTAGCLTILLLLAAYPPLPPAANEVRVEMETEKGNIEIALDAERAPKTTANFLHYVDAGLYNGGVFHRTVKPGNQPNNQIKIQVIQGGINPAHAKEDGPPIPLERTSQTGLKHLDGTISMARDAPDTATSDFFICIGDQPSLDFGGKRNPDGQGFAAFGRVTKGMDVVRLIQNSPANGQTLTPSIRILKVYRVKPDSDSH